MKKITHSLFFVLFLLGTFAFTKSDSWYLFESKAFSFKATFPSKPTEKTKVVNSAQGDLTISMFEFIAPKTETEPVLVYIVSHVEYPVSTINSNDKEKLKEFYRKVVDGMVTKVNGKLIKETIINLDGFEGVEARVEMKDGLEFVKLRIFLVGSKMYTVEASTETKNEFNGSINKFLDSFRLIK
jgi:hypothetical protein